MVQELGKARPRLSQLLPARAGFTRLPAQPLNPADAGGDYVFAPYLIPRQSEREVEGQPSAVLVAVSQ